MFKVGDRVYWYTKGIFGTVITNNRITYPVEVRFENVVTDRVITGYPLEVRFENGVTDHFTVDGRISTTDKNPTIFKQKVATVPVYPIVLEMYGNVYMTDGIKEVGKLYNTRVEAVEAADPDAIVAEGIKFTSESFYIGETK